MVLHTYSKYHITIYLWYSLYIFVENQQEKICFYGLQLYRVGFRWRNSHFRAVRSEIFLRLMAVRQ